MDPADERTWADYNQRCLVAALDRIRSRLTLHARRPDGESATAEPTDAGIDPADPSMPPSALARLRSLFELSTFEEALLVLCAGIELEGSFASLCAEAQGDPARPYPTFGLALAALADPHWSALTIAAPLRRWRLIEVTSQPGIPLTSSVLRIEERVLHYLAGIQHLDERLVGLVEPVVSGGDLVDSHRRIADRIATALGRSDRGLPLVELRGDDELSKREVAASACAGAGARLFAMSADSLPSGASEIESFARLWEREAALMSAALFVEADAIDPTDARASAISRLLERVRAAAFLSVRDRWRPIHRTALAIDVPRPTAEEQRGLWRQSLGESAEGLNGRVRTLVSQFNLTAPSIRASVGEALDAPAEGGDLAVRLWDAGRARSRPRLDDLAQRLDPIASWDDLVLPDLERQLLREITKHVEHRSTVYDDWGFAAVGKRGLGIGALFVGASGTGKTMAAEVLANALRLDLYRIDLSSMVSKYIGETEKNLRRVFDAAEDGGAILFFDEADALFGKRTEVKDSHDRYANIEINYLLQRMESYRGLAVLATNRKGDLDPAFLRRIRFVVNFPYPEFSQRFEIWRRVFPPGTPTEDLDLDRLARMNVAGGNIRNIALNAAFLAAGAGEPVRMGHLLRSARTEYAKIEKPLNDSEIGGRS